ncbi:hypothetical protein SISNIDRAFT_526058 [Sistotremastrum niveocremeum HHB9708]|uniref:Uncharacterized protein n=1 Tax=Sistotremastrum niveocremeum HHB9708 TaxID=1314777 RepID=A0A164QKP0_9AGAM|nr:hypothetical protein SISNIDRAFT_526058 [Sistotremastrum niveocremeum HHB9708]
MSKANTESASFTIAPEPPTPHCDAVFSPTIDATHVDPALSSPNSSSEDLAKEIEKLNVLLEAERKKNKSLRWVVAQREERIEELEAHTKRQSEGRAKELEQRVSQLEDILSWTTERMESAEHSLSELRKQHSTLTEAGNYSNSASTGIIELSGDPSLYSTFYPTWTPAPAGQEDTPAIPPVITPTRMTATPPPSPPLYSTPKKQSIPIPFPPENIKKVRLTKYQERASQKFDRFSNDVQRASRRRNQSGESSVLLSPCFPSKGLGREEE